ncbi:diphthamide synthesis protein [archaeon]|nr:diphthamide synthesis protein [archaeon]
MEDYDLELQKAVKQIKKSKAKRVCIQLPDGLKPKATEIADFIEKNTKAKVFVWLGSCYGSCDIPNLDIADIDLLIQWGHAVRK